MSRESGKDLTSGSPFGLILGFALPMLLGLLFQQFYNMVDTMVVGQCLGVTSLAAVGSTGSINFMINGFCIGAATGFPSRWPRNSEPETTRECGSSWPTPDIWRQCLRW